jgi:hypothetical protein
MQSRSSYVKPEVRTMEASEILESLGPVSAGSDLQASQGGSECTLADYMLGTPGC